MTTEYSTGETVEPQRNRNTVNARTVFALFFGPAAPFETLALGTLCSTRAEAATLLADRKANGDAFPGERVRELSAEQYNRHARHHGYPEVAEPQQEVRR